MKSKQLIITTLLLLFSLISFAQGESANTNNWLQSPVLLGMIFLVLVVLLILFIVLMTKLNHYIDRYKQKPISEFNNRFKEEIINLNEREIDDLIDARKKFLKGKV